MLHNFMQAPRNDIVTRDVPIPHSKPIPIRLPIPSFRADTDTADTTDTFIYCAPAIKVFVSSAKECI